MEAYRLYSSLPAGDAKKCRAEIDTEALTHNYSLLLRLVHEVSPGAQGICVVKADAYGHGADLCVPALSRVGCRRFAVSCIEEAVALREILRRERAEGEILILGYTPPEDAALLIEYDIIQCIFSISYATALDSCAPAPVRAHIKLDTGMNRIGFTAGGEVSAETTADELAVVCRMKNISVEGMFTHFARADEMTPDGDAFTRLQYLRFEAVDSALRGRGIDVGFRHACNSAGAVRFPQFALDGVRFGILLYGCGDPRLTDLPLSPVMSLFSRISHIHMLKKGDSLGYGGAYTADGDRMIATLPIGYADGFIRAFTGASLLVETRSGPCEARVVGRICMDQCMLDVTGTACGAGDTVRLFGGSRLRLNALAELAGTIDYELLCLVSARVPRVIKQHFGKDVRLCEC